MWTSLLWRPILRATDEWRKVRPNRPHPLYNCQPAGPSCLSLLGRSAGIVRLASSYESVRISAGVTNKHRPASTEPFRAAGPAGPADASTSHATCTYPHARRHPYLYPGCVSRS